MEDAIHTFSGKSVTALQVKRNCRGRKRNERIDVFHCQECRQIVFLCRKQSPFFRHQAHRGENCTLRKWSNGHAVPLNQSESEQFVKVLANRLIDALREALRQHTSVHFDSSIDQAVAVALMGREMLRLEGLDRNIASVLFHPYFAPLLRWILACVQRQTSISAMGPQILAAFVKQQYFKHLLTANLGNAIQEDLILGGLEPLKLSEPAGTFEFEVLYEGTQKIRNRARILYNMDTIDCVKISSVPMHTDLSRASKKQPELSQAFGAHL